jgi:hypothetical protein
MYSVFMYITFIVKWLYALNRIYICVRSRYQPLQKHKTLANFLTSRRPQKQLVQETLLLKILTKVSQSYKKRFRFRTQASHCRKTQPLGDLSDLAWQSHIFDKSRPIKVQIGFSFKGGFLHGTRFGV